MNLRLNTVIRTRRCLLLGLLSLSACGDGADNSPATQAAGVPTISVNIGSKPYSVEIAADETAREVGLMNRPKMASDHGMIFVFPDSAERNFWMKDTLIPLDIVFLTASGKVVSVSTMKAMDETNIPSHGEAKYAIELSAGEAKADGIKPGDIVRVPAQADAALNPVKN